MTCVMDAETTYSFRAFFPCKNSDTLGLNLQRAISWLETKKSGANFCKACGKPKKPSTVCMRLASSIFFWTYGIKRR